MAHPVIKNLIRNFLIVTIIMAALAILFANSQTVREKLSPPGLQLPPGVVKPTATATH